MSQQATVILWNSISSSSSTSVKDQSWIMTKEFECSNLTKVYFKAGSKDYALNNDGTQGYMSELVLKKKYR